MFPKKLTRIHQIELTSECNLACKYCPHPKMKREKNHMSLETYAKALEHVKYFKQFANQPELSLTGLGEPLMHPQLEQS